LRNLEVSLRRGRGCALGPGLCSGERVFGPLARDLGSRFALQRLARLLLQPRESIGLELPI
jgi:hypothetical protein